MSEVRAAAFPKQRSDVWLRKTDEEIAAFDRMGGRVHFMNETALAIWDLCDGETAPDEMVAAICELFSMHRDVVSEDVERTLMEFDQAGLIDWIDTEPGDADG